MDTFLRKHPLYNVMGSPICCYYYKYMTLIIMITIFGRSHGIIQRVFPLINMSTVCGCQLAKVSSCVSRAVTGNKQTWWSRWLRHFPGLYEMWVSVPAGSNFFQLIVHSFICTNVKEKIIYNNNKIWEIPWCHRVLCEHGAQSWSE